MKQTTIEICVTIHQFQYVVSTQTCERKYATIRSYTNHFHTQKHIDKEMQNQQSTEVKQIVYSMFELNQHDVVKM